MYTVPPIAEDLRNSMLDFIPDYRDDFRNLRVMFSRIDNPFDTRSNTSNNFVTFDFPHTPQGDTFYFVNNLLIM
jgi:hypothetical protein